MKPNRYVLLGLIGVLISMGTLLLFGFLVEDRLYKIWAPFALINPLLFLSALFFIGYMKDEKIITGFKTMLCLLAVCSLPVIVKSIFK